MARYLDPKADVTFKKVFGEHKNLVIGLLNALLPLDPGKQVESIEYLPHFQSPTISSLLITRRLTKSRCRCQL